jgi:V/A-type H+-transporting ATPase subunit K
VKAILAGILVLTLTSLRVTAGGEPPATPRAEAVPAAAQPVPDETTWQDAMKVFAAALAIGITAFATAVTQCRIGAAGIGALAENPKLFGNILIYLVIPETMVILGFVIAALILL